jgi:WD40 repeat protein/serine/threonine protein kinase
VTEREIFLEALEISTPEARATYLKGACDQDIGLRRKVEELLKEHFSNDSLIAGPAVEEGRSEVEFQQGPAPMLGRYKLLEKIGEGGFGEVWMAEQREPVKRRIALKIIKPGMDSRQIVARFEAERQALAMMEHPNIARIFDADVTEAGRPYFVMELVRGVKITEYCDQNQLSTLERLKLFVLVCQAIQHAHQKGIIHRDIKPSNILVTLHDGVPVPKVIDFGIAKATQQELTDKTVFTQFQQFMGTPAYISPEQAEMSGLDIDTRSDIYSLGVMLYELLVGQTPFDAKEMIQGGLDALRQIIREKEPLRPSTKLNTLQGDARTTAGKRRQTEVEKLVHQLQGDLDWIVMKCLEKDRTRRYETANGLAMDIQRHLANEPIIARPPSAAYKLQKAWQRNKLAWTATALVATALIIGIAVSTWQARAAFHARQQADAARLAEADQRQAAQTAQEVAENERAKAQQAADDRLKNLYAADIRVAYQALQGNDFALATDSISKYRSYLPGQFGGVGQPARADGSSPELLGWEWRYLWRLCRSDELDTLQRAPNALHRAVLARHDQFLVTASDRWLQVMDQNSMQIVATLGGPEEFDDFIDIGAVAFSPDGTYLAAKGGRLLRVWRVGQWQSPYKRMEGLGNHSMGNAVVFSPDGQTLATRVDGGIAFWDTATWQAKIIPGSFGFGIFMNYTGDGEWLTLSDWEELKILNARSLEQIQVLHRPAGVGIFDIVALDSCPQRALLAAAYRDGEVRLWEVGNWREIASFQAHLNFAFGLAFSPDGNLLATGGADHVIKIWDVNALTDYAGAGTAPKPVKELRGHRASIFALAFVSDGKKLLSASADGTVKVWDPLGADPPTGLPNQLKAVWFSPDARHLITAADEGGSQLNLWDTATLQKIGAVLPTTNSQRYMVGTVSDDGQLAALGTADGKLDVWNLQSKVRLKRIETDADLSTHQLAFSPNGAWLAAAPTMLHHSISAGGLHLWNLESHTHAPRFSPHDFAPLAFCSDGRRLVFVKKDGIVQVSDFQSGTLLAEWKAHAAPIHSLALSPDNRLLATGAEDATVRVWDIASQEKLLELKGHLTGIPAMAFAPDGRALVTVTWDSTIKFWHITTGRELFTVDRFKTWDFSARFSPNGEYLAVSGDDGRGQRQLMLWRAPTWEEIAAAEAKEKSQ